MKIELLREVLEQAIGDFVQAKVLKFRNEQEEANFIERIIEDFYGRL